MPVTGGGTGVTDFSFSGSAHKVVSAGFTNPASAKCAEIDASGNLQIAASNAACGSGGATEVASLDINHTQATPVDSRLTIQNIAGVSGETKEFNYSSGSNTITTSVIVTFNAGDIVVNASNPTVFFIIATTATGTSFTTSNVHNGNISNANYVVYRPSMLVMNNDGTTALAVTGPSGSVYIGHKGDVAVSYDSKLSVGSSNTNTFKMINTGASGSTGGAGIQAGADDGAALAAGDRLAFLIFNGTYGATTKAFHSAASIEGYATTEWSASNAESNLSFRTTPNGSTTRAERLNIAGSGIVRTLYGVRQKTTYTTDATYAITDSDHHIVINSSGTTVTFPTPSADNAGRVIQLRSVTSVTHTLAPTSGNTIWIVGQAAVNTGNYSWVSGSGSVRYICAEVGGSYYWLQIT